MNSTGLDTNITQKSVVLHQALLITKSVFFALSFFTYGFFLYFISNILAAYFANHHVRENSRYILFAHMLINDTMYLSLGLLLGVAYQFLYIPIPICCFLVVITTATFLITPYNLAAMSLERYIAICFPLRYPMFCTAKRSYLTIAVMWIVGIIPNLADFAVLIRSVAKEFFLQSVLCKQEELTVNRIQSTIRSFVYISTLVLVALIIFFTYVQVMIIAKKTDSSKSSASKSGKTVMLHAGQLLLSIVSLASIITEAYGGQYMVMANFLLFMCVPRLLSPLIYGIRDEVFSKCIRKMYFVIHKEKNAIGQRK
ncbi:odorant receptor 131-2-like [Pyxicephalus adspersus]|uniref:odorant receptor 131-2-like n=1 Tax=Pyxicephalus adspersus TaxID=30357 RepID=UPI003B5C2AD2